MNEPAAVGLRSLRQIDDGLDGLKVVLQKKQVVVALRDRPRPEPGGRRCVCCRNMRPALGSRGLHGQRVAQPGAKRLPFQPPGVK
jgi:hypothetical protein